VSVQFTTQTLIQGVGIDVVNSDIDPLTGLLNRRAFYRRTTELMSTRTRSHDRYLAVAMIDLDHFKRLNDTAGHVTGDRALAAIGRTLSEQTRGSSVVARVGGEEFLIADVLASPDAATMAERLRSAIVNTPPQLSASIGTVTTPIEGLATHPPQELIDRLVAHADAAMYEAKRAGGDQSRHRSVDASALAES
jgi:diguanylate cyclase (GGDEF)-like protein